MTGPSGGVTTFSRSADGLTETKSLSCGTDLTYKYGLDSKYKYKVVKELTESTPAGLNRVTLRDKIYEDTNSDEVPDLINETVNINGKAATLATNTLQATRTATSPSGRIVTSYYDPVTLLTSRFSISGLHDINYGYDAKGRLTSITQGARQTTFAYTAQGFLDSVIESVSGSQTRTTTYDHDPLGRVTGIHRPDKSLVSFAFDNNGNMTMLTNPTTVNHGFGYNKVDKKTSYQTPLSGNYQYLYDRDRRLTDIIFPSGRRIANIYSNGRLSQTQTPEGNIDFSYLCATKIGSVTKGSESISYGYDGPLVTSETTSGTLGTTLSYAYNNDFNLTGLTYAGAAESYAYDNDGLLTGAGGFTITRNASNGLPEVVTDTTYSLSRTFSAFGEVDAESLTVSAQSPYAYSLTRDLSGRITNKSETAAGATGNYVYTYDPMGRLLTVTKDGDLVEEYRYNANGVRDYEMNTLRGIAGRTLSYDDEDHLLTAGSTTYQYNLDGFLTTRTEGTEVTNYNYSSRGELLSTNLPGGSLIEYLYDPLGRRIAKKIDGIITEKYLWQGFTRLLAVYDAHNNLVMRFKYTGVRMPVTMTKSETTYYLAYDQVGSLRVVADASGNVVKRIDYDSFGNVIADSDPTFTVPFGFAGGLHDRDANLVRFGYRDYNPEIGRWTAKDPIWFSGGDVDLYGYVQNNPINWIDPYGLCAWKDYWNDVAKRMQAVKPTIAERTQEMAGQVSSVVKADTIPSRLLSPYGWNDVIINT
jgi:RHS repeat-associated protein